VAESTSAARRPGCWSATFCATMPPMLWPSSTLVRVAVASISRLTISAMPGIVTDSGTSEMQ